MRSPSRSRFKTVELELTGRQAVYYIVLQPECPNMDSGFSRLESSGVAHPSRHFSSDY